MIGSTHIFKTVICQCFAQSAVLCYLYRHIICHHFLVTISKRMYHNYYVVCTFPKLSATGFTFCSVLDMKYWFHLHSRFSKTRNQGMFVFLFQVCRDGVLLGNECRWTANFRPASYLFTRILHPAHTLCVTRVYYCATSDTKGNL